MKRRSAAGGFSLLEAIVALVVMSLGVMALFSWINTSLLAMRRAEANERRLQATDLSLEYVKALNPMVQQAGDVQLGRWRLTWTSEPLEPVRRGIDGSGEPGIFEVGLYQVTTVADDGATEPVVTVLRQAGFRQTAETPAE